MQEYDVVLKALLQGEGNSVLEQISGSKVAHWLPTELPNVENLRADLLGESADGELIHIELQSTNESRMAVRMGQYMFEVLRLYDRVPRRYVLYVGEAPLRMTPKLTGWKLSFEYDQVDIRDFNAETLLDSPWLSDNVIAILGRLSDRRETVRKALQRISGLSGDRRGVAFRQLSILAGLRRLEDQVQEEARKMPILNDIMDHRIIGPAILQGREEGRAEGRLNAMREVVTHLVEKRFGPIPEATRTKLDALTAPELDALALRVIDAKTLQDLFTGK